MKILLIFPQELGLVFFPEDSLKSKNLIQYADYIMYTAKVMSRNAYHFFSK